MNLFKVVIVAATILVSTLKAQAEIVSFGLSAGSCNVHYDINSRDGAVSDRYGFQAGVGLTFQIPILSISPEFIYTNNKFRINDAAILGRQCEVRDQTIDIPVVVGVSLFGPLTLEAGPTFSIYNRARATYYGESATEDLGRIHSSTGYILGVKWTLMKRVIIGARFYSDFDRTNIGYNGYEVRSYSYALSIGYKL